MALDTELRATTYAGNASTVIPYPILFPYLEAADIKVQVTALGAASATLLSESAYTVHEPVDGGAYVTTTAAYPATTTVEVFRFMDYLQPLVMPEGGKLSSVTLEQALDRVTMLAMQGGDGGYSIPSAGSRDSAIFADAGTRSVTAASRVGQLGVQLDNGSVWRALSTYAGDWQEIMPAIRSDERNVHTQAQLIAALAEAGALTIYVRKDIDLSSSIVMGTNKTLVMGDYRFTQTGAVTFYVGGTIVADRKQIFSGFTAGQITGTFGQEAVFPEWWGLQDGRHDIAINCAVKASVLLTNGYALRVSLGPRTYDVARSIDLGSTAVTIEGCGSNITMVSATRAWVDSQWLKCIKWGVSSSNTPNHGAMFWIGASMDVASRHQSYRTKLKGFDINCYYAAFENRATYRISGISSRAGVEECTVIHDVTVSNASGFGIGFDLHKDPVTNTYLPAATVNGLDISSCWILGATFSDFYGMHFSEWTNNCSVRNVTLDLGLAKSISSQYGTNTSPAGGGSDTTVIGTTIYTAPEWVCTYPHIAVHAAGFVTLSDLHIEGTTIGIFIPETEGASNVVATNIKAFGMMDRSRSAVYELDGKSGGDPPANTSTADYYGYSTAVLLAGRSEILATPTLNWKGSATLTAISTAGSCCYLVRDAAYGIHRSMFGMGQFPAGGIGGRFSFYTRGNIYARSTTSPYALIGGGTYDPANPTNAASVSRTFFIGPIY